MVENGEKGPREFRLTISDEALLSHNARYQDGPVICAHRLQRELAGASDPLAPTHYAITGDELEEYRVARVPEEQLDGMYGPQNKRPDPRA